MVTRPSFGNARPTAIALDPGFLQPSGRGIEVLSFCCWEPSPRPVGGIGTGEGTLIIHRLGIDHAALRAAIEAMLEPVRKLSAAYFEPGQRGGMTLPVDLDAAPTIALQDEPFPRDEG